MAGTEMTCPPPAPTSGGGVVDSGALASGAVGEASCSTGAGASVDCSGSVEYAGIEISIVKKIARKNETKFPRFFTAVAMSRPPQIFKCYFFNPPRDFLKQCWNSTL